MNIFSAGAFTSLGLGALTVVHPCPLSINVAALSFLVGWKYPGRGKLLVLAAFVAGEIFTFAILGILISRGALNVPPVANFLQQYAPQFLGPFLIIIGMMLAGIFLPNQHTLNLTNRLLQRNRSGIGAGFSLGILIALSFCPMSAALFFGVLIPLAVSQKSTLLYPGLFGIGSSLPLVIVSIAVSRGSAVFGVSSMTKSALAGRVRLGAGTILILMGILLTLHQVFGL